jgi:hypothetical protein
MAQVLYEMWNVAKSMKAAINVSKDSQEIPLGTVDVSWNYIPGNNIGFEYRGMYSANACYLKSNNSAEFALVCLMLKRDDGAKMRVAVKENSGSMVVAPRPLSLYPAPNSDMPEHHDVLLVHFSFAVVLLEAINEYDIVFKRRGDDAVVEAKSADIDMDLTDEVLEAHCKLLFGRYEARREDCKKRIKAATEELDVVNNKIDQLINSFSSMRI